MKAMLNVLQGLATVLYRLRAVLWFTGAVGAIVFVASAVAGSAPDAAGLAGLIAVVWSGYLLAVAHFFIGVPIRHEWAGLRGRIRHAFGAALVRVTAVLLLALGGVVLAFTFKAISATN